MVEYDGKSILALGKVWLELKDSGRLCRNRDTNAIKFGTNSFN